MNKYYYIVSNTVSEISSVDVAICEAFEEAKSIIPQVCDWYCPKGSGKIRKVNNKCETLETWYYFNNKLESHDVYEK